MAESSSFLSLDHLKRRRSNFQAILPDEILLSIARYTVEWSGVATLNESTLLEPKLQKHLTLGRGVRYLRKGKLALIEKGEHRTISSTLFSFRCVCRAWYRTGTAVFMECLRLSRYAHYSIIHIPPRGQMSLQDLIDMISRSGALRHVLDTMRIHLQMETVPAPDTLEILLSNCTKPQERQVYEQDMWRMWQRRMSDMQMLSRALSSIADIVHLLSDLPRLREIGVV